MLKLLKNCLVIYLSLGVVLLSSCGFHLRGAYQLPAQMSVTYIEAMNQNSELVRILKRRLKANGIQVVTDKVSAQAVLALSGESNSKRVISVDQQGRAREYELSYGITFDLKTKDSSIKLESQKIQLERE